MILILGGTTEGRIAVEAIDEAGKPYYYSTRSTLQEIVCKHGTRLTGVLDAAAMTAFCQANNIRLLVDAAHPFAVVLHQTIHQVAETLNLPTIRFERMYPPHTPDVVWCDGYDEAIARLEADHMERTLILTGVQTIAKLKPYWSRHTAWVRILERESSLALATQCGFDAEKLLYYHTDADEMALLRTYAPQAILTKESGESGGFGAKVAAAQALGIRVYVVKRPVLPPYRATVTGRYGLRRAIEQLLPGYYALRSGYTTGSCATAAAKSAVWALLTSDEYSLCPIQLPNGEIIGIPISRIQVQGDSATAVVIKDAGDDPDVTNGLEIGATVKPNGLGVVRFLQGEGVGRVTLPGLNIPIGEPAINATPRAMITHELNALCSGGFDVTIFVPRGREIAVKTFNPKLGIVDGISIIGTLGIVRPFSSEAYVEAVRREIEVCHALSPHLVLNSGAKSERYVKALFPWLPAQAFVHYGNFVGDSIAAAAAVGVKQVTVGIMAGKAVKLAEGILNTHSKHSVMNRAFIAQVAHDAACSAESIATIGTMNLARELWEFLTPAEQTRFFPLLLQHCYKHTAPLLPNGELTILLISEKGEIPYSINSKTYTL